MRSHLDFSSKLTVFQVSIESRHLVRNAVPTR